MTISSQPDTPSNVTWNTSNLLVAEIYKLEQKWEFEHGRESCSSHSQEVSACSHAPWCAYDRSWTTDCFSCVQSCPTVSLRHLHSPISSVEVASSIALANCTFHSPTPTQNWTPPSPSATNDLSSNAARCTGSWLSPLLSLLDLPIHSFFCSWSNPSLIFLIDHTADLYSAVRHCTSKSLRHLSR